LLAALALLGEALVAEAWGSDGHKITAQVAQALLSPAEMQRVDSILGEGASLASVATWADQVRDKLPWSAALHFSERPKGLCYFDYTRDCTDEKGVQDRCVVGAILNYTQRLRTSQDLEAKEEALKFVIHFLGDIHQPLHFGWTSNRGGNDLIVKEGWEHGRKTDLHSVWDEGIISGLKQRAHANEEEIAQNLTQELHSDMSAEYRLWSACLSNTGGSLIVCLERIANESALDACTYAYRDDKGQEVIPGEELGKAYFETRAVVVRSRLAAGGVRLAAILKHALNGFVPEVLLV